MRMLIGIDKVGIESVDTQNDESHVRLLGQEVNELFGSTA